MRSDKPLFLFRIWDIVLIVLLLALVGLSLYFSLVPEKGTTAEIYINGELYESVPLTQDKSIMLDHLIVVISDGCVHVEDADCPDKICEKRGAISQAGQSIVCLPNRVVIKITGKGEVEAIS